MLGLANHTGIIYYKSVNEVIKDKLLDMVEMKDLLEGFEQTRKLVSLI